LRNDNGALRRRRFIKILARCCYAEVELELLVDEALSVLVELSLFLVSLFDSEVEVEVALELLSLFDSPLVWPLRA
jgi:hypothetical protein